MLHLAQREPDDGARWLVLVVRSARDSRALGGAALRRSVTATLSGVGRSLGPCDTAGFKSTSGRLRGARARHRCACLMWSRGVWEPGQGPEGGGVSSTLRLQLQFDGCASGSAGACRARPAQSGSTGSSKSVSRCGLAGQTARHGAAVGDADAEPAVCVIAAASRTIPVSRAGRLRSVSPARGDRVGVRHGELRVGDRRSFAGALTSTEPLALGVEEPGDFLHIRDGRGCHV